jgi:hypothetical protein
MVINHDLSISKLEYDKASAGIRTPQVVILHAGDVLFRFGSTKNMQTGAKIDPSQWARGAWWFQETDYRKIIANYQAGKLTLGTVARAAGAVQPSWSNMDVSIKARLVNDINVYIGKGARQYRDRLPNGMYVTLSGWPDLDQVYIPGIRGASFTALQIVRQKIVTTDSFGFD